MKQAELYELAFRAWGAARQVATAIEEMAELIQLLARIRRYGSEGDWDPERIAEEIADVEIMTGQLRHCLAGVTEKRIQRWKRHKKRRLWKRLKAAPITTFSYVYCVKHKIPMEPSDTPEGRLVCPACLEEQNARIPTD